MKLRKNTQVAGKTAEEWKKWAQEKLQDNKGIELDRLDSCLTTEIDPRLIGIIRGCRQDFWRCEIAGQKRRLQEVELEEYGPLFLQLELGDAPLNRVLPEAVRRLQGLDEVSQGAAQAANLIAEEQGYYELAKVFARMGEKSSHREYLEKLMSDQEISSTGKGRGGNPVTSYRKGVKDIIETEDPLIIGGALWMGAGLSMHEQKVLTHMTGVRGSKRQIKRAMDVEYQLGEVLDATLAHPGCGDKILEGIETMRQALHHVYDPIDIRGQDYNSTAMIARHQSRGAYLYRKPLNEV